MVCCQEVLQHLGGYGKPVLLLIYHLLHYVTAALYDGTVLIALYSTSSTSYWCTGWCSGPVDTLLFLYCCACCLYPNVQQYTNCGTLLYQFMGRLLLFLLMLYIYCCSCLYFLPFTLAHFIYLLCFSYLEACNKCHASQFVVF